MNTSRTSSTRQTAPRATRALACSLALLCAALAGCATLEGPPAPNPRVVERDLAGSDRVAERAPPQPQRSTR